MCYKFILTWVLIFIKINLSYSQIGELNSRLKKELSFSDQYELYSDFVDYYLQTGIIDSQRYYADKMLAVGIKYKQDTLIGRAFLNIAISLGNSGQYKHRLEYLLKALEILENTQSDYGTINCLKEIGISYNLLNNYNLALEYLYKAKMQLPSNFRTMPNRVYTNMSETFLKINKPDSSLYYVQLANEVTSKDKDFYGYARVLYLFAMTYKALGNDNLAETFFISCIEYSELHNVMADNVDANYEYSKYVFQKGSYDQAMQFARKAYFQKLLSKDSKNIIEGLKLLKEIFLKVNNIDSAYHYAILQIKETEKNEKDKAAFDAQNEAFTKYLMHKELEISQIKDKESTRSLLQYLLLFLIICSLIIFFFALSKSVIISPEFVKKSGIVLLVLTFEYLNLVLHPILEKITHHSPLYMLLIMTFIAAFLIPIHHKVEEVVLKKLSKKNEEIHIGKAKAIINDLSEKP